MFVVLTEYHSRRAADVLREKGADITSMQPVMGVIGDTPFRVIRADSPTTEERLCGIKITGVMVLGHCHPRVVDMAYQRIR